MKILSQFGRWSLVFSLTGLGSAFLAERNIQIEEDRLPAISNNTDDWQLPKKTNVPDFDSLYEAIQTKKAWGEEDKGAVKKTTETDKTEDVQLNKKAWDKRDWQLLGLLQQARSRYILIMNKDHKIERYQIGDTLANGQTILHIDASTVTLKAPDNNDTEEVRLYQP